MPAPKQEGRRSCTTVREKQKWPAWSAECHPTEDEPRGHPNMAGTRPNAAATTLLLRWAQASEAKRRALGGADGGADGGVIV